MQERCQQNEPRWYTAMKNDIRYTHELKKTCMVMNENPFRRFKLGIITCHLKLFYKIQASFIFFSFFLGELIASQELFLSPCRTAIKRKHYNISKINCLFDASGVCSQACIRLYRSRCP